MASIRERAKASQKREYTQTRTHAHTNGRLRAARMQQVSPKNQNPWEKRTVSLSFLGLKHHRWIDSLHPAVTRSANAATATATPSRDDDWCVRPYKWTFTHFVNQSPFWLSSSCLPTGFKGLRQNTRTWKVVRCFAVVNSGACTLSFDRSPRRTSSCGQW